MEEYKIETDKCKNELVSFLNNSKSIPITTGFDYYYIDEIIANYLQIQGHDNWISRDSFGPITGGLSEFVLYSFYRENKVFKNKTSEFKIRPIHSEYGDLSFIATSLDNPYFK